MTVRIKFSKYGSLKFIGHLDVMRFFQKAVRRAGFDVCYSQGFHPHQLMSFAAPLGVGLTSDGEYVDIELHSCGEPKEMLLRLNAAMTEGFAITDLVCLPETEPGRKREAAMALIAAADYQVSIKDNDAFAEEFPKEKEAFLTAFEAFLAQPEIRIVKKTKKSEKEENIRPLILSYGRTYEGAPYENHAEVYENGRTFFLRLATGSVNNLKPELVMEAFCAFVGVPYEEASIQVHRIELYAKKEEAYVPLGSYYK